MKRIIFLNRFFAPDHSATSQLVSDLAFSLAEFGRDVHVITSRQLYDDPLAKLPSERFAKRRPCASRIFDPIWTVGTARTRY